MVNGRFLIVCGAFLALAQFARADGTYQRTRNGRTLVWNNHPKAGDEVTWSGSRDREGYARGFGTLIWYTPKGETGNSEPELYARYWGNMVRGKFDGPVNVHSKKKTHHAIFVDGTRATHWSAGTAPSRLAVVAKPNATIEPNPPAEGPTLRRQSPEVGGSPAEVRSLTNEPILAQLKIDVDESIRTLALPPRSLRWRK